MLRRSSLALGWHYLHPKNARPIKQDLRHLDPAYINNEVALVKGQWGLITQDFGVITQTQLENARLAILRRVPRADFNLVSHTDYEEVPFCNRPAEARRGGGRPPIHHFAYKFTTGILLFELVTVGATPRTLHRAEAEAIFLAGRIHLPVDTKVVPQGRVDEYSAFK
jgi:ribosomal protein L16/L10AE